MTTIRPIVPGDYPVLLELIQEFSEFENTYGEVTNNVAQMNMESEHIQGFIAEIKEEVAGYSTYYFPYHTWVGKCIHMDDLFIRQKFRGQGVGKALFSAVVKVGKDEHCERLRWQVSDWNEEAQAFYRSQGAEITNKEYDCSLRLR